MKKENIVLEIEKANAVTEEIAASFQFISEGLKRLKAQPSFVSNNHVALQLFAAGFERIVKILYILKLKRTEGNYPELAKSRDMFNKYRNGHDIKGLVKNLIDYSKDVDDMQSIPMVRDDLNYIAHDAHFNSFLKIITEFACHQRYYYIDAIVSKESNSSFNVFSEFKAFIWSFSENHDLSKLTHNQEEELILKETIVCIERGVRGISRFFTHGLGDLGRQHYGDFSNFILLNDRDLGRLGYTEKVRPSASYKPINVFSAPFLKILIGAKSKLVCSKDYDDWPFKIDAVRVYSLKNYFFFVRIDGDVFALTGATSSRYKIPIYLSSKLLKPKAYAPFLLVEAKLIYGM